MIPGGRPVAHPARGIEEAVALHQQGRLAEAEKIYARVLKQQPNNFDALHLLGMLNLQRGKAAEACRLIKAALKIAPRAVPALANLGLALIALKREDEALATFEHALKLAPDDPDALNNYGSALLRLGRPADALACYDRLLRLVPNHIEARANRAGALGDLGRIEEAINEYQAVLVAYPHDARAHFNLGASLNRHGRAGEALAALDRALALRPDHVKAYSERGLALEALGRHAEARASFAQAIARDKDYADAHYNHSLALLRAGDLKAGFAEYEWRFKVTGVAGARNLGKPLWLGEYGLDRKTILLHAEQGFGDTIQFLRYARQLKRMGARVVLEVPPELVELLAGVEGVAEVVSRGSKLSPFDVHCPLLSLPHALRTDLATIPADIPYLRATEAALAKWRPRLPQGDARFARVAIAWAGRTTHRNDRNRSIPLPQFLAPLASAEVRLVSVQRDLRPGDAEILARHPEVMQLGAELESFADTAAVLALCDLLITVDTSVAHLAGAMGRPVFILLPFVPDWRWMLEREDTPWYPTARLFRQHTLTDWDGALAQVKDALATFSGR